MENDYSKQVNEMITFITEYEIYLYSVLYQYASKYNYSWYCALHSPNTNTFIKSFVSGYRKKLKEQDKLPAYDIMNNIKEYDKLIACLPAELLVEIPVTLT